MTPTSELEVWLGGRRAGHLLEEAPGMWSFVYTMAQPDGGPPVSLALPRSAGVHKGERVAAVFGGLLPDGSLRDRLARSLGLSHGNDFALLARIARECPGALSLRVPGALRRHSIPVRRLDAEEVRHTVAALTVHPLLAEVDGLAKTLPGEFDKLPVRVDDDVVSIVLDDTLSTHVLKPARPGLREAVANEAWCMALAEAWGLPVTGTRLLLGPAGVLLSSRCDRRRGGGGEIEAIHMEDCCQALGRHPARPYEREGGPRLAEIAALLRRVGAQPGIDLRALVRWTIFGFLVGCGTLHGRQLGVLLESTGVRLAPFFGLWSTHVYPEMSLRMGLRIGLEDRPDWLGAERWRELAVELGVRPAWLLDELGEAARTLPRLARDVADDFHRRYGFFEIVRSIRGLIDQRARQTLVSLASAGESPTARAARPPTSA
ncbi:MAG: HipA domain-containing protein [Gammaproteobacteria bacterium]